MRKLYRFYVDYGRQGSLDGLFVEDDQRVKEAVGRRVSFGEVLGKHSDVNLRLEASHFSELTDDQDFINKFVELDLDTGHNPFNYLEEEEEEEDL